MKLSLIYGLKIRLIKGATGHLKHLLAKHVYSNIVKQNKLYDLYMIENELYHNLESEYQAKGLKLIHKNSHILYKEWITK